jgi:hypothetical protein
MSPLNRTRVTTALGRTLYFVCAILALTASAVAGGSDAIPSVLAERDDATFWIAADRVVGVDGKLNLKGLGRFAPSVADHQAKKLERTTRSKGSGNPAKWPELKGCESYLGTMPDHFEPTSSLRDLTTYADFIVAGRVVAIRQGFLGGMPGSLLLLSTDSIKGDTARESYLFYPLARIETSDGPICAMPVGRFVPPSIGDRVLVFSMVQPHRLEGRTVFQVNTSRELVHEPRKGPLQLPAALMSVTTSSAPSFDEVTRAVRGALLKTSVR